MTFFLPVDCMYSSFQIAHKLRQAVYNQSSNKKNDLHICSLRFDVWVAIESKDKKATSFYNKHDN